MDVRGDHVWTGPDTAATVVVPVPDLAAGALAAQAQGQGQLFGDAYPDFGDTDRIPVVRHERSTGGPQPPQWLRSAVALAALAVVAAGIVLALAQTGIIGTTGTKGNTLNTAAGGGAGTGSSLGAGSSHQQTRNAKALVSADVSGPSNADYTVHAGSYRVTVTTTSARCWVSIASAGHAPSFAGIVPESSSQSVSILGPASVEIGAGGSSVTLSASGHKSVTLTPPTAPFTYQFAYRR